MEVRLLLQIVTIWNFLSLLETHCFYVMRGNGESEDISVVKCFNNMQQNPPYLKEDEAAVKKEAAPAEEKSS